MNKKIISSSLVVGALLVMNGCGGGGSPSAAATKGSTVSGVAVDDLILDGVVTATSASGESLATGRTSTTDGSYTLNVEYTGVVLVNVTCDENSTMWDPTADISTAVSCGDEVSLNALAVVEEAGQDLSVNLSPLTEIMYQVAVEEAGEGEITEDDVQDARNDVGLMFGVDPVGDSPVEGESAAIIGAIHDLADSNDSTSVMDVTNALADELSDGEAGGDDTVDALVEAMDDANLTNNLTENNGTYTPPENPAALSDIDEAKELFTELRTQAMSVVDYNNSETPGFLDTEARAMDMALNEVVMNVGYMGDVLNVLAEDIGDAYDRNLTHMSGYPMGPYRDFTLDKTAAGTWSYDITEGSNSWSGTISFPEVLVGDTAEDQLYTSGTLTVTISGTVPLDYNASTEPGVTDSQSFNGTLIVAKTDSGADIALNGEVVSNGTSFSLTNATAELAYEEGEADEDGDTEPVFDYFKFNSLTVQGIVGEYTIDGSIAVNSYAQNAGLAVKGGMYESSETSFGGVITCYDTNWNVNGYYANATFTITLDGEDHLVHTDATGWYHGEIEGEYDINDFENALYNNGYALDENICPSGSRTSAAIYFVDSWSDMNIANSGWLPDDITFTGAISRTGASIEGTLNAKWINAATMDLESDTEILLVDIAFNGKLQMPDRPEMLTTLTFENSATNNTIGASYTYDTTVINLFALFDSDMENGNIAITTHTGLRVDLQVNGDEAMTGTVTKDGLLLGDFEEREGMPVIKYIDGSFELIL